jgi:hypothetical protein
MSGRDIPDELDHAGWEALLKLSSFCQFPRETSSFIASQHGSRNGYCEDLFYYYKPVLHRTVRRSMIHRRQEHLEVG